MKRNTIPTRMFLEFLLAMLLGICAGIITGLLPGVHINLVSLLLLSAAPVLLQYVNVVSLCVFIVSMAVMHSFLDVVPSILLGAPDNEASAMLLPGHRMLLQGRGFHAIKLTLIGSLFCLLITIALLPFLLILIAYINEPLNAWMGIILLALVVFLLLRDARRWQNLLVFSLSGVLGLIVLNMPMLKDPLFPLLSGLFGVSALIAGMQSKVKIPRQKKEEQQASMKKGVIAKALLGGSFAGVMTAFFPGVGPAQGAALSTTFLRNLGDEGYLILVGGIGTVNFVMSLVTLFAIEKARNGAVLVIMQLVGQTSEDVLFVLLAVAVFVAGTGMVSSLWISRVFAEWIVRVDYAAMSAIVVCFVTFLVFVMTGWIGLLVLAVSTSLGLLIGAWGVARSHAMGCLILPVLLYFLL
ncbi:tripartite tricarboxylate transporter permease [Candidatus Woesearchaeota archaeon]|nr:tripartite tricarboxylate transporter permease [Candidatus Woesearchaeota archaeon]